MTTIAIERAAATIRFAALAAYRLSLGGTPDAQKAFSWIKDPKPGDMVCETSSAYQRADHVIAVGELVRVIREPYPGDFGDEPVPLEQVFYIRCLDGVERRWTNADFIRIPETNTPWR